MLVVRIVALVNVANHGTSFVDGAHVIRCEVDAVDSPATCPTLCTVELWLVRILYRYDYHEAVFWMNASA